MKTPQILTGQQAIDQFGLNALIECRVAVTTELNGLGHSIMQIGVIADPDSCQIDEDDTGVLWVEYQGADDWYLYSIPADEQFVLLDDKNQPAESNAVLANSIAELTRKNSELVAQVEQLKHRAIDLLNADDIEDDEDRVTIHANMNDAVLATPDQCLIERDIEVANAAFMHAINLVRQRPERANHAVFISQKWGECEKQMRQQAKAGE